MKPILSILFCLFLMYMPVFSQKWVSTQQQNKNAILEEVTGVFCGECPDGHRMATLIESTYPGRVFLVNIDAGPYAEIYNLPGYIDLRIAEGEAIDSASNNDYGYPAGFVNRKNTPSWVLERGAWSGAVNSVLSEISPVNVFVKSSVDKMTRKLTTEVEFYYTGNSQSKTNYLTVMLTQDNIIGKQTGLSLNPLNCTPDGLYRHNHVLRKVLTSGGAFGEPIDTTTLGHFEYRKFVTDLPDSISRIYLDLRRLKVVAFVAESKGNIYSGYGDGVEINNTKKFDLGFKIANQHSLIVATHISPITEIVNNTSENVTSFDATFIMNNKQYEKTYTGNMAPDEMISFDWGDIPLAVGANTLVFTGFSNINSNGYNIDTNYWNDNACAKIFAFKPQAFSTILGGFDYGKSPLHFALDSINNNQFGLPIYGDSHGDTLRFGANHTTSAVMFYLWAGPKLCGKGGEIIFGEADMTKLTEPVLSYYYAYSQGTYHGTDPSISAQISTDKGLSWITIDSLVLTQTATDTSGNQYVPVSDDYRRVEINLSAYKDKFALMKVIGYPGTQGNCMYIDEISISESTGFIDPAQNNEYKTFPNPSWSDIYLTDTNFIGREYVIFSPLGHQICNGINFDNKIDIQQLNPGLYFIKINKNILSFVKI